MIDSDCDQQLQGAAYLLGALRPEEAERYREHLDGCPDCRRELEELAPAASAVPRTAKPARATEELLGRIMEQVDSEAELLNAAGPQADRVPTKTGWWRTRRLATLVATATVAAAAAIGALLIVSGAPPGERVTQAVVAASVPGGQAELRQNGARAELVVSHLPQPALGKIYQVWVARAHGAPQPTNALFSVSAHGSASVAVPGDLRHIQRLMVTAEPAGGSLRPTSPPIITATLKAS